MTPSPRPLPDSRVVTCRALASRDWPAIVELFGPNGACGGCWCMDWRRPRGGRLWEEKKGRPNRDAFRRLVKAGRVFGALAFAWTGVPAIFEWCGFRILPREGFSRDVYVLDL